jgi:hypothetical protein
MFPNGARIATPAIPPARSSIREGRRRVIFGSFAAVAGGAMRPPRGRRTVSRAKLDSASIFWGFVRRSCRLRQWLRNRFSARFHRRAWHPHPPRPFLPRRRTRKWSGVRPCSCSRILEAAIPVQPAGRTDLLRLRRIIAPGPAVPIDRDSERRPLWLPGSQMPAAVVP